MSLSGSVPHLLSFAEETMGLVSYLKDVLSPSPQVHILYPPQSPFHVLYTLLGSLVFT